MVMSKYIARPYSAFFECSPQSFRIPSPPYLTSAVDTTSPPPSPPWLTHGDWLHDPVLKTAQGPFHVEVQGPYLQPKDQHHLKYCLEEHLRYPRICPLSTQDNSKLHQTLLIIFQFPHHRRPAVVPCHHDPSQVLKLCYLL